MRTMAVLAALAAAAFMAAGCVTRVTARTRTNTDGSTESYVTVLGTGDKASDVASEGLFADGTRETLGAGVSNAKASQQSTGVDGALAAAGNLFAQGVQAGMAAYGLRAAPAAAETREPPVYAPATAPVSAPRSSVSAPRSSVSGDGCGFVVVLGNRATCSLCRSLWAGLDAAALSERLCGAGVIDADAAANPAEYARYKPDGPFAYPLVRVFGADGKPAGQFSARGLSADGVAAAAIKLMPGCGQE